MTERAPRTPSFTALLALAIAAGCSSDGKAPDAGPGTYAREKLLDPATCNECHQDHFREWSGSMHAYASKDPLFRAMNKRGQEETGGELGNFCVNCHAPMAVVQLGEGGTIVDPANIPEALSGITCYFCHTVKDVTGTHNNPLVLAGDVTMRGGIRNPLRYKAHEAQYSKLHDSLQPDSAKLCGACHDIQVPAHFSGADGGASGGVELEQTYAEWKSSIFADATRQPLTCGGCHLDLAPDGAQPIANPPRPHPTMPTRLRHLHDFPAVDTAFSTPDFPQLPDAGGGESQAARIQFKLDSELRVEICVDQLLGNVRVTLENIAAGHAFPSGASQDRRLWLETHVSDGKTSYSSGVVAPGESVTAAEQAAVAAGDVLWLFRDVTTKVDGTPAHMFWDVAGLEKRTIPPPTPNPVGSGGNLVGAIYATNVTKVVAPTDVTVKAWLEPVGRDVIDDLVASGHLEKSGLEATALPRFALLPKRLTNPDAGGPDSVTFEWTREEALGKNGTVSETYVCLQTTKGPAPRPTP